MNNKSELLKSRIAYVVDMLGKTKEFLAWLKEDAGRLGRWCRGEDTIEYDPDNTSADMTDILSILGIEPENVDSFVRLAEA